MLFSRAAPSGRATLAKSLTAKLGSFGEVIAAPWRCLAEVEGSAKRRHVLSSWTAVHDHIIVGRDGRASLGGMRLI